MLRHCSAASDGVQHGERADLPPGTTKVVSRPMLAEIACKAANYPPDKPRTRFTDDGGLYLEVSPAGSKRWFWKYAIAGKEKRFALGSYPEVKLKAAREARDDARKLQRAGTNPVMRRRVDKAAALAIGLSIRDATAPLDTPPCACSTCAEGEPACRPSALTVKLGHRGGGLIFTAGLGAARLLTLRRGW